MFRGTIVLGSASPRRKQLVEALGLPCEVRIKSIVEDYPDELDVYKVPEFLAELKSRPLIEDLSKSEVLLTSDTVVIMDGEILHKPKDAEEAKMMLTSLSDNMNEVVTGVCLRSKKNKVVFSSITKVYFAKLLPEDIDYYIDRYQPFDKAGAYGIQEWIGQIGVKSIEGCFYNVMGLPVQKVWDKLNNESFL
jgi:septum formation protein